MKKVERLQAIELRKEGKAITEIAKVLGVSKGTVSYWVNDVLLTDAQQTALWSRKGQGNNSHGSVVQKEQALVKRREYQKQGREMAKECDREYAMGCMLFWAEGSKSRRSVVFTNTDVDMVVFFVRFMRKYFECKTEDFTIKITAYLDNGNSSSEIEDFWLKKLKLTRECLKKSVFNRGDGSGGKYRYGICRVMVNGVEVTQMLYGSIQELLGIDREMEWANLR